MSAILKKGSSGSRVKILQDFLDLKMDGEFGPRTEVAVKKWQSEHGLKADGIVGPITWSKMGLDQNISTDLSESSQCNEHGLIIKTDFLPKGEYFPGPTNKDWVFLHHTAGWHNPYNTIKAWAADDRGRIATEFVLGGPSVRGNDDNYDGELVQCIPTGGYGWHLGKNGSQTMHTNSVGIEVCNFGYIINGKTYAGTVAHESQIVELPEAFRGHKLWHRYSDEQIKVLKNWILFIADRDNIDVRKGLIEEIKKNGAGGFEFNENAYFGRVKGLWTHTNTRKDKVDMFPQPELIDMLLSI